MVRGNGLELLNFLIDSFLQNLKRTIYHRNYIFSSQNGVIHSWCLRLTEKKRESALQKMIAFKNYFLL